MIDLPQFADDEILHAANSNARAGTFSYSGESYRLADGLSRQARRNYYLDMARTIGPAVYGIEGVTEGIIAYPGMTFQEYRSSISKYPMGRRYLFKNKPGMCQKLYRVYVEPLTTRALSLGVSKPFLVLVGDNDKPAIAPAYCKSRLATVPNAGIILKLDAERHFGSIQKVAKQDLEWSDKEDRLVWRGVTTGKFSERPGWRERTSRSYVAVVRPRLTTASIDIGYSRVTRSRNRVDPELWDAVKAAVVPPLEMAEQLRAKFLLSLEGNDTSTGLKWMLASNSAVIMPAPQFGTWACEPFLEPMLHYIPVKPDLSDLEAVFEWCLANDNKCKEIAMCGKSFSQQLQSGFVDDDELQTEMMKLYARNVTLELGPLHQFDTRIL